MFTTLSRLHLVIWLTIVSAAVALSAVSGARWSTTGLFFILSSTPMGVMLFLRLRGARSMTTHELLYAIDTNKDVRT